MVAARNAEKSPAFHLGMTVLGPVLTAFDTFIVRRCAVVGRPGPAGRPRLSRPRRLLSHRIWQDLHGATSAYLEINRRVSLIASADTMQPLVDLSQQGAEDRRADLP